MINVRGVGSLLRSLEREERRGRNARREEGGKRTKGGGLACDLQTLACDLHTPPPPLPPRPSPKPHPRVKGMEEADARLQEVVASLLTEHGGNHEQALRQTFACLHNSGLYEAQSPAEEEQREQQVGSVGWWADGVGGSGVLV